MDAGLAGKSDVACAVVVGEGAHTLRQMTNIHTNKHSINFDELEDNTLHFTNVDRSKVGKFHIVAIDDDGILGFDTIGKTNNIPIDEADHQTKHFFAHPNGKIEKKSPDAKLSDSDKENWTPVGKVTYSVEWQSGAVAAKGHEAAVLQAPWAKWVGYPNYDDPNIGGKVGTDKERNTAKLLGFSTGLLAGASAGLLDLVNMIGKDLFVNVQKHWGPVAEAWKGLDEELASASKHPSFANIKRALTAIAKVCKAFIKFVFNAVIKSKSMMMIAMCVGVVVAMVLLIPHVPTIVFTLANAIFSAAYIFSQFKNVYKNLFSCKQLGGKCMLSNVHTGWGAIGRLVGYIAAEILYMKSFQKLWKEGKELIKKLNPKIKPEALNVESLREANAAAAKRGRSDGLTNNAGKKATNTGRASTANPSSGAGGSHSRVAAEGKGFGKGAGNKVNDRAATNLRSGHGQKDRMLAAEMGGINKRAPKLETGAEIKARLNSPEAIKARRLNGRMAKEGITARARGPKVETAAEIKARMSSAEAVKARAMRAKAASNGGINKEVGHASGKIKSTVQ